MTRTEMVFVYKTREDECWQTWSTDREYSSNVDNDIQSAFLFKTWPF